MGLGRALWDGTKALGRNTVTSYTNPYHGQLGFSVLGAGIGSMGGAMLTGMSPYGMGPGEGAAVGAVAGGLALPALGAFGALSVNAATTMYKNPVRTAGGFGGASIIGGIAAGVGAIASGGDPTTTIGAGVAGTALGAVGGAIKPGAVVGVAAGAATGVGKVASGMAKSAISPNGPVQRYGNLAGRTFGGILKYTPERSYYDEGKGKVVTKRAKMGLTNRGLVAGSAIGLGVMAKNFVDDLYESRAGTPTGVSRATPSYLDNAGASGDLVFAMHQNRRG